MNRAKKEKKESVIFVTLIMGFIVAAIIFIVLLNIEKNTIANYERSEAVVAKKDIPYGLIIDEKNVNDYFQIKEYEKDMLPSGVCVDAKALVGMVMESDVNKDSIITSSMYQELTDTVIKDHNMVKASFEAEKLSQVVNGTLRPGDKITIAAYEEGDELYGIEDKYTTKNVWDDVFVYEVFDSTGVKIPVDDDKTAAQLITVLINKEDMQEFYLGLNTSTLQVIKLVRAE